MAIDAALGRLGIKEGVCTSSTRPANPFEGQLIYETDTNRTLVYDNAAWLVVADNQVLSIDSTNGRVGVNDTSPSYALDVTGDINATNLRLGGTEYKNRLGDGAAVEVPGTFAGGDVLQAAEMNALPAGVLDVDVLTNIVSVGVGFPGTPLLTVTATLDTNRRYRVRVANSYFLNTSTASLLLTEIFIGSVISSNRKAVASAEVYASNEEASLSIEYIVNGGVSGSQTFTATCRTNAGTADVYGNPSIPMFMYLEDIGAV